MSAVIVGLVPRGAALSGDAVGRRSRVLETVNLCRYDALCWFRITSPLEPLHLEAARRGELETMPTGV